LRELVILDEELLKFVDDQHQPRQRDARVRFPEATDVLDSMLAEQLATFLQYRIEVLQHADAELAITLDGVLAGQVNLSSIVRGAFRSCTVGYWIGRQFAGRSAIPLAVALAGDYAMARIGLHRIEINIRPENAASLSVVRKLGFRDEGPRPRYLHIDGAWRDHLSFALTAEEIGPGGLVARLHS